MSEFPSCTYSGLPYEYRRLADPEKWAEFNSDSTAGYALSSNKDLEALCFSSTPVTADQRADMFLRMAKLQKRYFSTKDCEEKKSIKKVITALEECNGYTFGQSIINGTFPTESDWYPTGRLEKSVFFQAPPLNGFITIAV